MTRPVYGVLNEILSERGNQDERWGEQNHPNGTGPDLYLTLLGRASRVRDDARMLCDAEHKAGRGTWQSIATEEFTEALAESDSAKLRRELVQSAAVFVAWIECIDRNANKKGSDTE